MKKYVLVALTLLVGASFNTVAAQKKNKKKVQKSVEPVVCCTPQMKTAADTLSYAAGVVRTEGLIPCRKAWMWIPPIWQNSSRATNMPSARV